MQVDTYIYAKAFQQFQQAGTHFSSQGATGRKESEEVLL